MTYYKEEMWILTHMLQKDSLIVTEGGSIGLDGTKLERKKVSSLIANDTNTAIEELTQRADPYIQWQLSKSTGHYLTETGKASIKWQSSHTDTYYGNNGLQHYLFITKCDKEELPPLPNLTTCTGEGYNCGWGFDKKMWSDNFVPCDNGTHGWWKLSDLLKAVAQDTTRSRFHTSMHELYSKSNEQGTVDMPGWSNHNDAYPDELLHWDQAMRAILTDEERNCADTARTQQHHFGQGGVPTLERWAELALPAHDGFCLTPVEPRSVNPEKAHHCGI